MSFNNNILINDAIIVNRRIMFIPFTVNVKTLVLNKFYAKQAAGNRQNKHVASMRDNTDQSTNSNNLYEK